MKNQKKVNIKCDNMGIAGLVPWYWEIKFNDATDCKKALSYIRKQHRENIEHEIYNKRDMVLVINNEAIVREFCQHLEISEETQMTSRKIHLQLLLETFNTISCHF